MTDSEPFATRCTPKPPSGASESVTHSTREVDASTVYAEGIARGLMMAAGMVGRADSSLIPRELRAAIIEWQATAIHREWLAEEGRAAQFLAIPVTDEERFALSIRACPYCKKVSSCI